jgi:hypothetical protein
MAIQSLNRSALDPYSLPFSPSRRHHVTDTKLNSESWPQHLDALIAAPTYHRLLLENASVRVLDTCIPSGETAPLHCHAWPSVLYILSWSAFVRRDREGNVLLDSRTLPQLVSSPGTLWSPPLGPHTVENVGTTGLRVIAVELKQGAP